jgi:hypothetical protein
MVLSLRQKSSKEQTPNNAKESSIENKSQERKRNSLDRKSFNTNKEEIGSND